MKQITLTDRHHDYMITLLGQEIEEATDDDSCEFLRSIQLQVDRARSLGIEDIPAEWFERWNVIATAL